MIRLSLLPVVLGVLLLATALRAAPPTNVVIHPDTPGGNTSAANSNTLSPSEWQELRAARMAALKANPAFVTKATQLNEKLREFEQKLNTAMMKTDPKIAPVLAKFAGNRPPAQPAGGPSNAPKPQ